MGGGRVAVLCKVFVIAGVFFFSWSLCYVRSHVASTPLFCGVTFRFIGCKAVPQCLTAIRRPPPLTFLFA